ncbi:3-phosphoshikimate 1-carboxyvinyltransferase [Candidatus Pandoraea novymonadis]|uniref:3-phosphoshikimate 1-carboxyvinyltransferase n=1 Tax=Candidatus Pandoraea novymonadis TaxID=1808959 RepID=A0ABX5FH62_9BURK|nr:3-phosphoshikimate 1-carboxyvinyltransferase [Candidatus Pandoraea novymonadis]PSB92237.1 3-phosphoshikimate 1-carboxyvinyltransferase [Candidatus Pandoraea novymonadis]
MNTLNLGPYEHAQGIIRLPGSKSISNRVLLLSALSRGQTRVRGVLASDDTRVMLDALRALGVNWMQKDEFSDVIVDGCGGNFPVKAAKLFMGNAGTAVRPLTAVLALNGGDYELSGIARMHERPIGDLVDGLRQLGARIDYFGNDGFLPLRIHSSRISIVNRPIKVRGSVSSQFLTALLMTLPLLPSSSGEIVVEVEGQLISKPYIDITLKLLRRFGIDVREEECGSRFILPAARPDGPVYRSPGDIFVEGDASSASYFLAAGVIGEGPLRVEGVGRNSIQGDIRFTEVLEVMGARIVLENDAIEVQGIMLANRKLKAIDMDVNHIPDAAMTIAILALCAEGTTTLRNIGSWRVKETDRLTAMATELRKVGATVEEGSDYLRVMPPDRLTSNAIIDTYDDHRMAMCFSLVSLIGVAVTIKDPQCVAKTFPDYFRAFQDIVR